MNRLKFSVGLVSLGFLALAGCSSGQTKRKEQQVQVVKSSKIYCEFVNGENQQDVDVVLNLQMGARCDYEKPHSLTSYKTPADITGVMFCCGIAGEKTEKAEKVEKKSVATKGDGVEPVKEAPVVPAAMPPVQDLPNTPAANPAPATPKVEDRKPNAVKPAPQPGLKAPAKSNPYSELDL